LVTSSWSSGELISLDGVTEGDLVLAEVNDPEGRVVVLLARIWEQKVTRDHPELAEHVEGVMRTVAAPDHVAPDLRAAPARRAVALLPSRRRPQPLAPGRRKL
jgi:hypothetical protein